MKKGSGIKWNKYLIAGLCMTGLVVLLAVLGIFWTPYSTTTMSEVSVSRLPPFGIYLARIILDGIFFPG